MSSTVLFWYNRAWDVALIAASWWAGARWQKKRKKEKKK